jgi:hypothetical protein
MNHAVEEAKPSMSKTNFYKQAADQD